MLFEYLILTIVLLSIVRKLRIGTRSIELKYMKHIQQSKSKMSLEDSKY